MIKFKDPKAPHPGHYTRVPPVVAFHPHTLRRGCPSRADARLHTISEHTPLVAATPPSHRIRRPPPPVGSNLHTFRRRRYWGVRVRLDPLETIAEMPVCFEAVGWMGQEPVGWRKGDDV